MIVMSFPSETLKPKDYCTAISNLPLQIGKIMVIHSGNLYTCVARLDCLSSTPNTIGLILHNEEYGDLEFEFNQNQEPIIYSQPNKIWPDRESIFINCWGRHFLLYVTQDQVKIIMNYLGCVKEYVATNNK